MIKVGSKIKVPSDGRFLKIYKNQKNGEDITSFFYNIGQKDDKGGYFIKERYVVEVLNIVPKLGETIKVEEIISVESKKATDKAGKEYLNVYIWTKCSHIDTTKPNNFPTENAPTENSNNNSYQELADTLTDYADYI